jgi:S-formylglutathione hydrolase FrmB
MLLTDLPTVLAQHGLPVDRFGVLGWSMGGFGALIAAAEAPGRFVAVVANAPAFWRSYEEAREVNPGAFDSAEDWQRWGDLMARAEKLRHLPLRIDCGESDSFTPAIKELRGRLGGTGAVHLAKGCHDDAFWRFAAPEQLRFIGTALTPPKPTAKPSPTKSPAK